MPWRAARGHLGGDPPPDDLPVSRRSRPLVQSRIFRGASMRRVSLRRSAGAAAAAILLASALSFAPAGGAAETTPPDGFYRYPTIGGGVVVFASEGDLWKVPL